MSMSLPIDGKLFEIPKVGRITLYPISKVSQALTDAGYPRSPHTLRVWEKSDILPPASFRSSEGARLYSQEQIDVIVNIVVKYELRQGLPLSESFKQELWDELTKLSQKYS